jgi:hypothetical protein
MEERAMSIKAQAHADLRRILDEYQGTVPPRVRRELEWQVQQAASSPEFDTDIEAVDRNEEIIYQKLQVLRRLIEELRVLFVPPKVRPAQLSNTIRDAFRGATCIYHGVLSQDWKNIALPLPELQALYRCSFLRPYSLLKEAIAEHVRLTCPQPRFAFVASAIKQAKWSLVEELPGFLFYEMEDVFTLSGRGELARLGRSVAPNGHKAALDFAYAVHWRRPRNNLSADQSASEISETLHKLKADLEEYVGTVPDEDFTVLQALLELESTLAERDAQRNDAEKSETPSPPAEDGVGRMNRKEANARTADDRRQKKPSELARVGPEHLNLASPSAPEALELVAGGFIFRAKTHELSGRPRAMLAALLDTDNRRMTAEELREALAIDDDAVNFPEQVVKDTAIKLRKALKSAALESGLSCENPLRSNGKGRDLTYILDMP